MSSCPTMHLACGTKEEGTTTMALRASQLRGCSCTVRHLTPDLVWSSRSTVARRLQRHRRGWSEALSHCARRACQQGIASRQFGSPPVGHATCRQRGTRSVRRSCLQATIVCGGRPHQDPSHQSWPRVHRLATRGGCIPILNGEWWDTVLSSWCGE